jgi:large subunit ribosomal protein L24
MARLHIKKGDIVVVLWGEDKGKTGKVLQALPEKGRVLVEGVNLVSKALRKSQDRPKGGIVQREQPIAASKVMLQDRYDARKKKRSGAAVAEKV